ncbi:MAG TPA: TIGR02996 domain-containing protein [Gemmataceae bacterium]|jgi:uncharacterized protein (TIGR02996 family)
MTPDKAFLQAILEEPDDDGPRLIYADWLEEHGYPERAEFIRAQIELAKPPAARTRTRRRELERRVKALWKQHGPTWAKQPGGGSSTLEWWERGFCSYYWADDFATLVSELPRRLTEAPIQRVGFNFRRREDAARLLEMPLLHRLRSLCLFGSGFDEDELMGDADIRLLTQCPHLAGLEELDLTQHRIGPEGLRQLAHAPGLPALHSLALYENPCGDEGLRILSGSPLAPRLRKIHLSGGGDDPLTAAGVRVLTNTPTLANLRVLNFDNTTIGDAGARCIARSVHFSSLTELWLHSCEIRDAGVKAIAASPHLANLEVLDLSTNWTVGHAAAVALLESPYLKRLRYLNLWRCERLTGEDERMLRVRFRSRVNFQRS